ncbi:hypothetical protein TNCV_961271 [Trichonephila clavipes]|uniref:Uncharacterized protein n=1 Tax=Trichonephila clavipes TaxID=2585209 RepID=A0A8X6S0X3_TRICX|nr:hypothetical protein TNCV_961271 [Trichonephila clavipes]
MLERIFGEKALRINGVPSFPMDASGMEIPYALNYGPIARFPNVLVQEKRSRGHVEEPSCCHAIPTTSAW